MRQRIAEWRRRGFHPSRFPGNADAYSALLADIDALEAELKQFRVRVFGLYRAEGSSHTTACTIWGDNGQGGTAENFVEPLPCNCGALNNWHKAQIDALEQRLEAAERDMKRLDWLEAQGRKSTRDMFDQDGGFIVGPDGEVLAGTVDAGYKYKALRAAIDAAEQRRSRDDT